MAMKFITPKELLKAANVTELQRDDYFIFLEKPTGPSYPAEGKTLSIF